MFFLGFRSALCLFDLIASRRLLLLDFHVLSSEDNVFVVDGDCDWVFVLTWFFHA